MTRRSIEACRIISRSGSPGSAFSSPNTRPEFTIHHANPAPIVHDDEAIEHRAEDRLNAEFALAKAFFEFALTIDQRLERESDAPRLRIGADQKFSRGTLVDNGLGQLFHILPRSNPSSPNDKRRRDKSRGEQAKRKPDHERSAFPDAIAETAHGLDRHGGFAQFFPQPAHVRIHRASVDQAFVTPNFIEQAVARLHPALPLHQHAQQFEFDAGQPHGFPAHGDVVPRRIERDRADRQFFSSTTSPFPRRRIALTRRTSSRGLNGFVT